MKKSQVVGGAILLSILLTLPVAFGVVSVGEYGSEQFGPGFSESGIHDSDKLIKSHEETVMKTNVIQHKYEYIQDASEANLTTRIDRNNNQKYRQVETYSGIQAGTVSVTYLKNGTEYSRFVDNDSDVTYSYSEDPYSTYWNKTSPKYRAESMLETRNWELDHVTAVKNGINYSTYSVTGPGEDYDQSDLDDDVEIATIVLRHDGVILKYHERGREKFSERAYEIRITTHTTYKDVLAEPSWTDVAERREESDENDGVNPWECGPNDIDGDGDGLCNET